MWRGFIRDKMALFFIILFPLMFLFLFGGIFSDQGQSRSTLVEVGEVPLLSELPGGAKEAFEDAFDVQKSADLDAAIDEVRSGDVDAAVEQHGDDLVLHFSRADQVKAATVLGTVSSFVDGANVAASGQPPTYTLTPDQVEDDSLESIQYLAPGLLGWAIAMSATFGAALTLVQWRTTKLLRRLRLAPVSTGAIVAARVFVSLAIAAVQMVIFVGIAMAVFDLKLTDAWWMSVPLVAAGTLSFMAIGLLAGSVSKTAEGASGIANLIVLPMAFLSGSFIPLDVAPGWLQTVSTVFPLRYLNEGMLDVMVRGEGPAAAAVPIAVLLAFTLVIGAIATWMFRWEAD
ncbi:MAG: ABC transporter permease [Propionibacteriales bacterium]|nr:ABC transporter permease [Propionibacteriales bacterium]